MNLAEDHAAHLLQKAGIATPQFYVAESAKQAERFCRELGGKAVIKALVHMGKRGQHGLVRVVTMMDCASVVHEMMGRVYQGEEIEKVLVSQFIDVQEEWYVSILLDRTARAPRCIFSALGGIAIEDMAKLHPDKINSWIFSGELSARDLEQYIGGQYGQELVDVFKRLRDVMLTHEALLVEINPLAVADDKLIALDAKMIVDDSACFRHKEFVGLTSSGLTVLEKKARQYGLPYVDLGGNIGIVGNGAGLVMSTVDVVSYFGGHPANFCDVGGGSGEEAMEHAIELVLSNEDANVVLVNIFGGITRCDNVARAIIDIRKKSIRDIPFVVRLVGTNEKTGRKILEDEGIDVFRNMEDAVEQAVAVS